MAPSDGLALDPAILIESEVSPDIRGTLRERSDLGSRPGVPEWSQILDRLVKYLEPCSPNRKAREITLTSGASGGITQA